MARPGFGKINRNSKSVNTGISIPKQGNNEGKPSDSEKDITEGVMNNIDPASFQNEEVAADYAEQINSSEVEEPDNGKSYSDNDEKLSNSISNNDSSKKLNNPKKESLTPATDTIFSQEDDDDNPYFKINAVETALLKSSSAIATFNENLSNMEKDKENIELDEILTEMKRLSESNYHLNEAITELNNKYKFDNRTDITSDTYLSGKSPVQRLVELESQLKPLLQWMHPNTFDTFKNDIETITKVANSKDFQRFVQNINAKN